MRGNFISRKMSLGAAVVILALSGLAATNDAFGLGEPSDWEGLDCATADEMAQLRALAAEYDPLVPQYQAAAQRVHEIEHERKVAASQLEDVLRGESLPAGLKQLVDPKATIAALKEKISSLDQQMGQPRDQYNAIDEKMRSLVLKYYALIAQIKARPCKKLYFVGRPWVPKIEIGYFGKPTGPFWGAQFVGSSSHVGTTEFFAMTDEQTNHFDDTGNGFGGGVNGGYNWMPWGSNIVTGVVFDANGLNDKVNHTFPGGTFIGSTVNFEASADLRAGVLVTPSTLLSVQTGVSVADQRLQINFGGPITDTTQWTAGYNLGGGAEWMLPANVLPWGRSTSLFINYEHTWWDKASLTMPAASPFFNYTWLRQSDAVEVGFRIRFGDPGAAISPSGGVPMAVKAPPSQ